MGAGRPGSLGWEDTGLVRCKDRAGGRNGLWAGAASLHVLAQSSKEWENSKLESGLPEPLIKVQSVKMET